MVQPQSFRHTSTYTDASGRRIPKGAGKGLYYFLAERGYEVVSRVRKMHNTIHAR